MCNQTDLIINRIFKNSVYICGKISGLPKKEVQEKFAKASLLISDLGGFYVNPLDHMISDYTYDELCNSSKAYEEQMEVCLDLLEDCSTIFLLPDWTDSEGAKREVNFALSKGITVITLEGKKVVKYDKYSIKEILDEKRKQDNYKVYKNKYPRFSKFTSIVAFITPQFIKNFLIKKRVKLTQSDYESICKAIIKDALIGHSEIVVRNKYRFSIDFSFDEEEKKLNVYIACWGIAENRRFTDVDEERLQQFFDIETKNK